MKFQNSPFLNSPVSLDLLAAKKEREKKRERECVCVCAWVCVCVCVYTAYENQYFSSVYGKHDMMHTFAVYIGQVILI